MIIENKKNLIIEKIKNEDNETLLIFTSYKTTIAIDNITSKKMLLNNKKINVSRKGMIEAYKSSSTTLKQLKHFINNYVEYNFYTSLDAFEKKIQNNNNIILNQYI